MEKNRIPSKDRVMNGYKNFQKITTFIRKDAELNALSNGC